MTYLECWTAVAKSLLAQALAGEPELVDSLPKPMEAGSFGFAATLDGEEVGQFSIFVDSAILDEPLLGEGTDQKTAWAELVRELCEAAAGEWLTRTGRTCRVARFEPVEAASQVSRAFQLRSGDRAWTILVRDEVSSAQPSASPDAGRVTERLSAPRADAPGPAVSSGVDLLLDVELEATLRFGCREMPLLELLELGPGDVVQLDRGVSDPVDLIVGDKIVARGEVVLVNGNFGLRVTEVAAPRKRLESIRCLF
jgi:flagellar motor switch protein FliN/FliY